LSAVLVLEKFLTGFHIKLIPHGPMVRQRWRHKETFQDVSTDQFLRRAQIKVERVAQTSYRVVGGTARILQVVGLPMTRTEFLKYDLAGANVEK